MFINSCGDTSDFTHGQINFLCLTDFAKVKIASGNFHGYVKKNKRITHDSSQGNYYGLLKTQSG